MQKIIGVLFGAVLLMQSGCGFSPNAVQAPGSLSFRVQWPEKAGFQTQALPEATESIEIEISGAGLNKTIKHIIQRRGTAQEKLVLTLPPGEKRLVVTAFDGSGKKLAEARETVKIIPGQLTRSQLDLKEIEIEILPSALPEPSSPPGGGSSGGNGNTNPSGEAGESPTTETPSGGGGSEGNDSPQPGDNLPLDPNNALAPELLPSSLVGSSGGGGGGGSNNIGNIEILEIIASHSIISGLGYPTELVGVVDRPELLGVANYRWSCEGGCGSFTATVGPRVIWLAPLSIPGPALPPYLFTIKLEIVDNNGTTVLASMTKEITVLSGVTSVTANGGQNQ